MKLIKLSHSTLFEDDNKTPKILYFVIGPGTAFMKIKNDTASMITGVGGAVTVLETPEQIARLIKETE